MVLENIPPSSGSGLNREGCIVWIEFAKSGSCPLGDFCDLGERASLRSAVHRVYWPGLPDATAGLSLDVTLDPEVLAVRLHLSWRFRPSSGTSTKRLSKKSRGFLYGRSET